MLCVCVCVCVRACASERVRVRVTHLAHTCTHMHTHTHISHTHAHSSQALARAGRPRACEPLLRRLVEAGGAPDAATYRRLAAAYARGGRSEGAHALVRELRARGDGGGVSRADELPLAACALQASWRELDALRAEAGAGAGAAAGEASSDARDGGVPREGEVREGGEGARGAAASARRGRTVLRRARELFDRLVDEGAVLGAAGDGAAKCEEVCARARVNACSRAHARACAHAGNYAIAHSLTRTHTHTHGALEQDEADVEASASVWLAMLRCHTSAGDAAGALELCARLERSPRLRACAGARAYACVMHEAARAGEVASCEALVARMEDAGVAPDAGVFNALLEAHAAAMALAGSGTPMAHALLPRALAVTDRLESEGVEPNARTRNLVVKCYTRAGDMASAEALVAALEEDGQADAYTYNTLLVGWAQSTYSTLPEGSPHTHGAGARIRCARARARARASAREHLQRQMRARARTHACTYVLTRVCADTHARDNVNSPHTVVSRCEAVIRRRLERGIPLDVYCVTIALDVHRRALVAAAAHDARAGAGALGGGEDSEGMYLMLDAALRRMMAFGMELIRALEEGEVLLGDGDGAAGVRGAEVGGEGGGQGAGRSGARRKRSRYAAGASIERASEDASAAARARGGALCNKLLDVLAELRTPTSWLMALTLYGRFVRGGLLPGVGPGGRAAVRAVGAVGARGNGASRARGGRGGAGAGRHFRRAAFLDLHSFTRGAAQIAVAYHLAELCSDSRLTHGRHGLTIVTGRGLHSPPQQQSTAQAQRWANAGALAAAGPAADAPAGAGAGAQPDAAAGAGAGPSELSIVFTCTANLLNVMGVAYQVSWRACAGASRAGACVARAPRARTRAMLALTGPLASRARRPLPQVNSRGGRIDVARRDVAALAMRLRLDYSPVAAAAASLDSGDGLDGADGGVGGGADARSARAGTRQADAAASDIAMQLMLQRVAEAALDALAGGPAADPAQAAVLASAVNVPA